MREGSSQTCVRMLVAMERSEQSGMQAAGSSRKIFDPPCGAIALQCFQQI